MEALKRIIYHEKQEPGSMLCAQHALNALLQGNYFSALDLGSLAQSLDELEGSYRDRDAVATSSRNMDDTGYFSVQVIDKALHVWGLSIVRWRSEELLAYQHDPDTQDAFILNLDQHWFTIRRFGAHDANGHWFNLNSFFDAPQQVSRTYLGMVLQQAETEGYSVFSVRPLPGSEASVPASEADEVASTIPVFEVHPGASHSMRQPSGTDADASMDESNGFEDEDIELQRALQASLMDSGAKIPFDLDDQKEPEPASTSSAFAQSARQGFGGVQSSGHDEIQATIARGQALLERARREQAMALQEGAGSSESVPRRSRAEEEEEEMIRRAMAESLKSSNPSPTPEGEEEEEDDDDEYFSDDDANYQAPPASAATRPIPVQPPQPPLSAIDHGATRVVDDEDAELQRALQASMEGLPEGFIVPNTPPRRLVHTSSASSSIPAPPAPKQTHTAAEETEDGDEDEDEEEETASAFAPVVEEKVDVDEMRRRRLARFGG